MNHLGKLVRFGAGIALVMLVGLGTAAKPSRQPTIAPATPFVCQTAQPRARGNPDKWLRRWNSGYGGTVIVAIERPCSARKQLEFLE